MARDNIHKETSLSQAKEVGAPKDVGVANELGGASGHAVKVIKERKNKNKSALDIAMATLNVRK